MVHESLTLMAYLAAIRLAGHDEGGWIKQVEGWKALGATSVIVEPRGASAFPKGDLDVLKRFRAALA